MSAARILIAEDEPVGLMVLTDILGEEGYEIHSAGNGADAWQLLAESPKSFDVVLLDRMLPDMDGIEILRRMKDRREMAHLPVIMQTSMSGSEAVAEGLKAGAYYYLVKPFAAETLIAIVGAAIRDHQDYLDLQREVRQASRSMACLDSAAFGFRTTDEARDVATLLAQAAPDPGRVVLGLSELMLNAIEHGNLGITYDEKTQLGGGEALAEEIDRRLVDPDFARRIATVEFVRNAGELRFIIRDQGKGFDWQQYLEMSPERAFDTHGRGIAMSKLLSFDKLEYRGCGNEVEGVVNLPPAVTPPESTSTRH